MSPRRWIPLLALFATLTACRDEPNRLDPVPEALKGRLAVARAAAADLKKTLGGRLTAAMKDGPDSAIDVCAKEAEKLSAEVGARHGVKIGRSSTRLRNPRNAPSPWVKDYLDGAAGKMVRDLAPAAYDLKDDVGVVLPIATEGLCVTCHGKKEELTPAVRTALEQRYPTDQATGFELGSLRGVVWVRLAKK